MTFTQFSFIFKEKEYKMTLEKKITTGYMQNASSEAQSVNYLVTITKSIWISSLVGTAIFCFNLGLLLPALIIMLNALMSLKSVQMMIFKHYGAGKITLQYITFLAALGFTLT